MWRGKVLLSNKSCCPRQYISVAWLYAVVKSRAYVNLGRKKYDYYYYRSNVRQWKRLIYFYVIMKSGWGNVERSECRVFIWWRSSRERSRSNPVTILTFRTLLCRVSLRSWLFFHTDGDFVQTRLRTEHLVNVRALGYRCSCFDIVPRDILALEPAMHAQIAYLESVKFHETSDETLGSSKRFFRLETSRMQRKSLEIYKMDISVLVLKSPLLVNWT